MVDKIEATDPTTVVVQLKFATDAFLPALADPYALIYNKANLDKDIHWYEKNILGSGPFKFVSYDTGQSIKGCATPTTIIRACLISMASPASMPTSRPCGSMRSAPIGRQSNFAASRPTVRRAEEGSRRQNHSPDQ